MEINIIVNIPIISIIIPTYKPGEYFEECLKSIALQDYDTLCFEVIIILNGDKEPYYSSINRYIFQYNNINIKLIYTPIPGVSNARNIGIDNSLGSYVTFIDDDDTIDTNYLSCLNTYANDSTIVLSNVNAFGKRHEKFFLNNWISRISNNTNDLPTYKLRSILSVPWAKLIPARAIEGRRYDVRFKNGEDSLFITSLTNNITDYVIAEETSYNVRMREGSASRKKINLFSIWKTCFLLCVEYISIFLSDYKQYDFKLFSLRIPGVIKHSIQLSRNR